MNNTKYIETPNQTSLYGYTNKSHADNSMEEEITKNKKTETHIKIGKLRQLQC